MHDLLNQEHAHDHHPHTHEGITAFDSKEQAVSILTYMLEHNISHAEELHEICHKLEASNEFSWGAHYYKAFQARCLKRLAGVYGHCAEKLAEDAAAFGAAKVPGGDCSIEFDFIPDLTIRATVWEGDEEFPANAQILFSDNFLLAFSAEEMAAAGDLFMNALKGRW